MIRAVSALVKGTAASSQGGLSLWEHDFRLTDNRAGALAQCQKAISKKNSNFSNNSFCLLQKKKKTRMIIKRHHREVLGGRIITISRGGKRGIHPPYRHVHTLIYDQVGWRIIALMIWGTKKFSEINFHRNFRAAEQMIMSLGTYRAPCTILSIAQEDVPSTIL